MKKINFNTLAFLQSKARLGTNFLEAEVVSQLLGVEAKDSEILYNKKVAESLVPLFDEHSFFSPVALPAKKLIEKFENKTPRGTMMLCNINSWYEKEDFFTKAMTSLAGNTYIISREPAKESMGKNIFDCQFVLINHAKNHLPLSLCSEKFQQKLKLAEQELKDLKTEIAELMQKQDSQVIQKIVNLISAQMFLGGFHLLSQFIFVDNQVNSRRLLNEKHVWTKSISSDAHNFVCLGCFDGIGMGVNKTLPWLKWDSWGILFSCSIEQFFA